MWRIVVALLLCLSFIAPQALAKEKANDDHTFYYITIDRFNNGETRNDKNINLKDKRGFYGGDIVGVTKQLEYINKLGYNSVVLSPAYDDEVGFAGDKPLDFAKLEEKYGTMGDLKSLVNKAKRMKMRVYVTFDWTRVSVNHPWAKRGWAVPGTERAGSVELNLNVAEVQQQLVATTANWLKETNASGIYFRHFDAVPLPLWQQWFATAPKVETIAEVAQYKNAEAYKSFPLTYIMANDVTAAMQQKWSTFGEKGSLVEPQFGDERLLLAIDSHDNERFTRTSIVKKHNPETRIKQGIAFSFAMPGAPFVQYATEVGVDGGAYPDNQGPMNFQTDKKIIDYMTKVAELRKQYPALRKGSYDVLYDKDGFTIVKRQYKDETFLIVVNNDDQLRKVEWPEAKFGKNKELRGLLSDGLVRPEDGKLRIYLERESIDYFAVADKSGLNMKYIVALVVVYVAFFLFLFGVRRRSAKKEQQQ